MRLTLDRVSYAYRKGESHAVRDVTLSVEPGEFLAVAGRSGSGKSTLVQLMKGLLLPTSGQVLIDGEAPAPERFDQVGLVFQYPEHQLFAPSVLDDVAFGPRQQGLPAGEAEARVQRAMAGVGLPFEQYRDRNPFELSGGERRRVAIAGVLALEPMVLIADEPTAGLDLRGRRALFTLLEDLRRRQGKTVVVVTHRLEEVLPHATRLLVMDRGRVVSDGAPAEVLGTGSHNPGTGEPLDALVLRERLGQKGWPTAAPPWDIEAVAAELLAHRKRRWGE